MPIAPKMNLYDSDGKPVRFWPVLYRILPLQMNMFNMQLPRNKDQVLEEEFNALLEACASIAHQHRVRRIGSKPLSLGHTLDTLLA